MIARKYFAHENPDHKSVADRVTAQGYGWGAVSENIAAGQDTARSVVDAWMRSTGHCQNILSPDATELGVGIKALPPETNNGLGAEWTQVFARPIGQDPPSTDTGPRDGCPAALPPDQGSVDDTPQTEGATYPRSPSLKIVLRGVPGVRVKARTFGRSVVVGGVVTSGSAGRRIAITVTRYRHAARRSLVTSASGTFAAKLRLPRRSGRRRRSAQIVVTVRVLAGVRRLKTPLPGGQGLVR